MRANTLEDELSTSATQVRDLKVEFQEANDNVWDLETQVKSHKEEVTKKEEYIALLEDRYAKAIAKSIQLEGQIIAL